MFSAHGIFTIQGEKNNNNNRSISKTLITVEMQYSSVEPATKVRSQINGLKVKL